MSAAPPEPRDEEPSPLERIDASGQTKPDSNSLVVVAATLDQSEGVPAASLDDALDFLAASSRGGSTQNLFRFGAILVRESRRKDQEIIWLREERAGLKAEKKERSRYNVLVSAAQVIGTVLVAVALKLMSGDATGMGAAVLAAGVILVGLALWLNRGGSAE